MLNLQESCDYKDKYARFPMLVQVIFRVKFEEKINFLNSTRSFNIKVMYMSHLLSAFIQEIRKEASEWLL